MALLDSDIADLLTTTQANLGPISFNQIAQTLPDYEVMSKLLKKDRVQFDSGTSIQRKLMLSQSNAATMTGLYDVDTINISDVMVNLTAPWRYTKTYMAYDRREVEINSSPAKIVDLVKVRETDMLLGLAELLEDQFWSKPDDSTDTTSWFGVPYWVVKSATTGFNGGDPAGFTSGAGGIATATYPNWKNRTGQYTTANYADLISLMRGAARHTNFKSPVPVKDLSRPVSDRFRIYTTESILKALEDVARSQNESVGRDVAFYDNKALFHGNNIVWVPKLDADTTNPVYMLDWAYWVLYCLKGEYLRRSDPKNPGNMHNVFAVYIDLASNVMCTDRRRQTVLATA